MLNRQGQTMQKQAPPLDRDRHLGEKDDTDAHEGARPVLYKEFLDPDSRDLISASGVLGRYRCSPVGN